MNNLFQLPTSLPPEEIFEALFPDRGLLVERIISSGQTTPPGEWYDQARDEWVVLLQGKAELSYADGSRTSLKPGDYVLIPAHCQHRVDYTSTEPCCIWLAIHGNFHLEAESDSIPHD